MACTCDQVKPGAGDGDGGDTGKSVTCIEGKTGPRGEKGDRGPAGPPGPRGDKGEPYVPYLMWGEEHTCIIIATDQNMFYIQRVRFVLSRGRGLFNSDIS